MHARPGTMHARPGDEVVIRGHRIGEAVRRGEILETRGEGGTSPFVVRWDDTGHTTVLYPGTDCEVHQTEHRSSSGGAS